MSATSRTPPRKRFAIAPAVFLAAALGLTVQAQPPEPPRKPAVDKSEKIDPKAAPAPRELPGVRLPDGTILWYGPGNGDGDERVSLSPQDLQKLQDQIDQLKKQLAARKAVAPSGCAIRGRVEKRGEQLVAVLQLSLTVRTTMPQTPVALGGKRAFLVAAKLDGGKLPVLETVEDGFAAVIESAGDHTLSLDLEAPVSARGTKPELGFELGLPRAAITTLLLDPPDKGVSRVNLTTRTPDPAQPARSPEPKRVPALDVKQFAPRPGHEAGYALGPVDSLEVTWDPPAAAAQPAESAQSAELDVSVLFTEAVVESTARFRLRGPARTWKVVAPSSATLTAERAPGAAEAGAAQAPTITGPAGSGKTEWSVEFPAGSLPVDWVLTAVARQARPKAEDPKHRGPYSVGPFAVLDVLRQTGTVLVTAGANTRLVFKHGPDLRRDVPPPAAAEEEAALFRLATGPTGKAAVNAPLLTVEAWRVQGRVAVRPTYKLTLTDAGWRVRAELKVSPIGTEIDALAVEVPVEWRGLDPSPAELAEGVQAGPGGAGFWAGLADRFGADVRAPASVRLTAAHRQPFDLVLTATVPVQTGAAEAAVPLPRFPGAIERDATLTATVPEGLEVRGEARAWEGERAATYGVELTPANGKGRAVTSVAGRADGGFARAVLSWQPHRPDLAADVRADVTLFDRQLVVHEVVRLRSADGLRGPVRFRGPPAAAGLRAQAAQYPLEPAGPGEWRVTPPADARDFTLTVTFATPLPPRPADGEGPWRVPVGLLWPAGATRGDTTVRVWTNTPHGRTLSAASPGWRELPVEPAADRDALPVLALAASGGEVPLELHAAPADDPSAVAAWVDRGLVQAWSADDGATRYRARFLLRRWLEPAVEVRLPGPPAGPSPEFYRDGQKVEAAPLGDADGGRAYRVPLPEARPGRTTTVEVRYQAPAGSGAEYHPPALPAAAFAGPVRWHVTVAPGSVPLLLAGGSAETRWYWRGVGLAPGSAGSPEELEQWLRAGDEPRGGAADAVTARQPAPGVLTIYRAPRLGFTVVSSVAFFAFGLLLTRLPGGAVGPAVVLAAGVVAAGAALWPQPAAQAAAAAQPGLLAVLAALAFQLGMRWYYRHRAMNLPGFARSLPEPSTAPAAPAAAPAPSSRNRAAAVGSSGAASAAPAGG